MPANPRAPRLVELQQRVARTTRNPQHQFQIAHIPFTIQPFLLAPVLPGETMKNLMLQSRVVSDPINNPLIGWWLEYYIFYVKHRDLPARDTLTQMVLDPNFNAAPLQSAASQQHYHAAASINWSIMCLQRVVEEYFRDQGEAWSANSLGGLPIAQVNNRSWLDSIQTQGQFLTPDVDVEGADANSTIQASEVEAALRQWEFMRYNNMTSMDYEDFLATYGVRPRAAEEHRPELIRYIREWSYPVNTVNPADGTPSSALSWKIAESATKDRFFREPGFIYGVTVARPKVYRENQAGNMSDWLDDAYCWLPATLSADPQFSWRRFAIGTGPCPNFGDLYMIDVRDLFLYGDQFTNLASNNPKGNLVALPTSGGGKRYVSQADVDELFKTPATNGFVKQDGVVSLSILGRQYDSSPRTVSATQNLAGAV